MPFTRTRIFTVFICAALLAVLALPVTRSTAQTPLKVVATFSILGDLVANVAADKVDLKVLVGAGSDTHTYEPSPADSATLSDAALIFEIGAEFESWLDALVESSGAKGTRIVLTEGLELLKFDEHDDADDMHKGGEGDKDEGEDHDGEHEHGEFDPHVWHDVSLTIKMVERIRDALVAADAENADAYMLNAAAYIIELGLLDADLLFAAEELPEARRTLITTHDTFAYFGARYGFAVDSALGATTEAADPSAGEIAALIERVKAANVPAIFADNVSNPRLMEQIAREAGVSLAPPLFTDALGEAGSEGESYLKMMRYNMQTIVEALSK
ncbi:MAG: metal ABC transporter substrate-binding protein [Chloroflexi bacterium CFX4]|nr:metal ABC transporter substrate-binding protein [Chloroflexi bacterium CFX4]MDL1920999.1 metal ABC transporter substrate-binding protein [Chloroflexi bacterium CFX3]